MARVQLSGMVSSIRGSVAGTTFQNSSNGQIMRNKPIPNKSSKASQSNIKLIQSILNYQWAALTDLERSAWSSKINTQFRTAKQAFMNANFYLQFQGLTLISTPAFNVTPSPVTIEYLVNNTGSIDLVTDTLPDTDTHQILIKCSSPIGNTVTKSRNNLRLLRRATDEDVTQVITSSYIAAFGQVPAVGSRIWVSIAQQNILTGDLSAWNTLIMEVTAP